MRIAIHSYDEAYKNGASHTTAWRAVRRGWMEIHPADPLPDEWYDWGQIYKIMATAVHKYFPYEHFYFDDIVQESIVKLLTKGGKCRHNINGFAYKVAQFTALDWTKKRWVNGHYEIIRKRGTMKRLAFKYKSRYQSNYFQEKIQKAKQCIRTALELGSYYVAFSGGKDSSVVLHLTRSINPAIPAVWSDDEWFLPETKALIDATDNVHQIQTRAEHADWFVSHADSELADIPTYARSQGWDGCLLGLRAAENSYRKIFLRANGLLKFSKKDNMWLCNPVGWWNEQDVWTYIFGAGVPYNAAYDKLIAIGAPEKSRRIGPFANRRAMQYGQLVWLKRGWPELFNRFATKYPEARQYV